jgi:site-specific DNA-methyltransferase (adenine-specific)
MNNIDEEYASLAKDEIETPSLPRLAPGQVYCMSCLDGMAMMDPGSVDLVWLDLPSGRTRNEWDRTIPLGDLWARLKRVAKPRAVFVFVAIQPYASTVVASNPRWFRYEIIWRKNKATGFLNSRKQPLRSHENILVFYRRQPLYQPQMTEGHEPGHRVVERLSRTTTYGSTPKPRSWGGSTLRYPITVLDIPVVNGDSPDRIHSSQKPEALAQHFIRTYTQPGDLVLDPTFGSGSALKAAQRLGRRFIGFELDAGLVAKAAAFLSTQGGKS